MQASLTYCTLIPYYKSDISLIRFVTDEDGGSFALHATNAVQNHASKTREAWKEELSSEEVDRDTDDLY